MPAIPVAVGATTSRSPQAKAPTYAGTASIGDARPGQVGFGVAGCEPGHARRAPTVEFGGDSEGLKSVARDSAARSGVGRTDDPTLCPTRWSLKAERRPSGPTARNVPNFFVSRAGAGRGGGLDCSSAVRRRLRPGRMGASAGRSPAGAKCGPDATSAPRCRRHRTLASRSSPGTSRAAWWRPHRTHPCRPRPPSD